MFQLANIIWGEAGSSDDHIVPYPEVTAADLGKRKEWNQEATSIKLAEQRRPDVKFDVRCRKRGSTSKLDNNGGPAASEYDTNSWPGLSLCSAAKTDQASRGGKFADCQNYEHIAWVSMHMCRVSICLCLCVFHIYLTIQMTKNP